MQGQPVNVPFTDEEERALSNKIIECLSDNNPHLNVAALATVMAACLSDATNPEVMSQSVFIAIRQAMYQIIDHEKKEAQASAKN